MQDRVRAVASFYTRAVEETVVRTPEQWFWMHKRWRTRPLEEKESVHMHNASERKDTFSNLEHLHSQSDNDLNRVSSKSPLNDGR